MAVSDPEVGITHPQSTTSLVNSASRDKPARLTAGPRSFPRDVHYLLDDGGTVYLFFQILSVGSVPNDWIPCGDEGIRTPDLRRAKAALSQLSYIPGTTDLGCGPFRART
jgi:hypothetical protein